MGVLIDLASTSERLQPHSSQPSRSPRISQLSAMHVPVVGDILQAKAIGAERILEALRHLRTHLVEIVFGKRVQERHRRLANLAAPGKDLVKRRKLTDVSARLRAVEDLLPLSQNAIPALHQVVAYEVDGLHVP